MSTDLQRYLDGELSREVLPPEVAAEAEEWDRLLNVAADLRNSHAPRWLESRVMASLPADRPSPAWRRLWRWWIQPRPVRMRPVAALAGALVLVLLIWQGWGEVGGRTSTLASTDLGDEGVIYVQFVLSAEGAHSVSVAGDFNGWDGSQHLLRDVNGDGIWTGMFALTPGLHKYMFVVDGEQWLADPRAERYVDDGFGTRNSLLAVLPPQRTS
jgi:hypothetical protein